MIEELLPDILKTQYGCTDPVVLGNAEGGYKANTFIVKDAGKKFFIKGYHKKRSREQVLKVHEVKKFFNKNGVATISPLENKSDSTVFEIGDRCFAVFPFVSKKQYFSLPPNTAVASAGENLARLHKTGTKGLSLLEEKKKESWNKEEFIEKAEVMLERAKQSDTAFDQVVTDFLTLKLKLAHETNVTYESLGFKTDTIIHGDYHYHNLFYNDDDTVAYTFDFERTKPGPRIADFMYGLFMICFDSNTEIDDDVSEVHFERAKHYIQAYHNIFPLNEVLFQKGFAWFFYSKMVFIYWPLDAHYFENDTRGDVLVPKRLNRLQYFREHYDKAQERLLSFLN